MTITNKSTESDSTGFATVIKYEWVRDSKAEHIRMEDGDGNVTVEMISIGDKSWIWMGMAGMGWVEQSGQAAVSHPSVMPTDWQGQFNEAFLQAKDSKWRFDKKGTETVNNVSCTRYEFEYTLKIDRQGMESGEGTVKSEIYSHGDIWVAAQSGLPAVMIRSISKAEVAENGKKSVMETVQDLTDIGTAIVIKPPDETSQIPSVPPVTTTIPPSTPGTTTPPPPAATATTSPPAVPPASTGGTTSFSEEFNSAWNSRWSWTDPNGDAAYSLTARPGFLRVTVPEGNDLAGFTNYDAPRLLVSQSGNFVLETLIEFDPLEDYQGAGLLVWQDENSFLRLEFGLGGMLGNYVKNAAFLEQFEGNLGLVDAVELPDNLTRIELRFERNGNQFTAWCRPDGGDWQEIGSTGTSLGSTVQVGITQATTSPSAISADFDYVKLSGK